VGEGVVSALDADPAHPRLADGVGVLEGGDAGEVGGEAVDDQVDLHLAQARHVVVVALDAGLELGDGVAGLLGLLGGGELLLHVADPVGVLFEQLQQGIFQIAATKAGVEEDFRTVYYPEQKSFIERILSEFSKDIQSTYYRIKLGESYEMFQQLERLKNLQGVMAIMPFEIEIK
jgi:hypothetical protein